MVLRASSYIPPDVSDRGLILATLVKGTLHPSLFVKHDADIMLGSMYAIAKQQRLWNRSYAKEFQGTVKEVIGTCHSLGITIDGRKALAIQQEIIEGRLAVPDEDQVPAFMQDDGRLDPRLCKDTYMTDEEKQAMKDKSTAKMKQVRHRG